MRKKYIPVRERHHRKTNLSFSGVVVSIFLLLAIVSVISAVQASFIKPPLKVTNRETPSKQTIRDEVVASEIQPTTNARLVSISNPTGFVANFPLEKAWPIHGRLTTLFSNYHPAIDLATSYGTSIQPFASGVITKAGWWGGYGNCIVILHAHGWESLYAHLSRISVAVGQEVNLGTVIGAVGSTGYSTGPHLHFQLSKGGRAVNPLSNLP